MRSIAGTLGTSRHTQDAIPVDYSTAYMRNVAEWADTCGISQSAALARIEHLRVARMLRGLQCKTQGHDPRPCWGLGKRPELHSVCIRCGEELRAP